MKKNSKTALFLITLFFCTSLFASGMKIAFIDDYLDDIEFRDVTKESAVQKMVSNYQLVSEDLQDNKPIVFHQASYEKDYDSLLNTAMDTKYPLQNMLSVLVDKIINISEIINNCESQKVLNQDIAFVDVNIHL